MKAIETRYKGYRFRSRLEARWAVFFDALGLEWDYELEGFEFSDGTRYLPDFKLRGTDGGFYVEVKGVEPSDEERRKATLLAREGACTVLMVIGTPSPDSVSNVLAFSFFDAEYDISECVASLALYCFLKWNRPGFTMCGVDDLCDADMHAIRAARSARFEFGEVPV